MASAIIHICVAKKVNEVLHLNEKELFLGAIAPDISKQVGESKNKSHFLLENTRTDIPNLDAFYNKYKNDINLEHPFEIGYYCHLYADMIWFKYFMPMLEELDYDNTNNMKWWEIIYKDYTDLNIKLIDKYNLDLSLFYEEYKPIKSNIDEIPIDKLKIIIDKMGIIIENSKNDNLIVMDKKEVYNFINACADKFIELLKDKKLI